MKVNRKRKSVMLCASLCVTTITANAVKQGEIAPGCDAIKTATHMDGLTAYRGKVVYLDFWASWCSPCRKSMPALNRLRNELKDSGFELVAINVDENNADAQQFLSKHPVDYPVILDPAASCPEIYGLQGMPTSYLIDRNGVIRDIHTGYRHGDVQLIRARIVTLLEEDND